MAHPASPGAAAPRAACAQESTALDLHAQYLQQSACSYSQPLALHAHQAQQLAASLRGITAITAVLMAEEEDVLHLGNWLRAGLIDAVHTMARSATDELEAIHEHARREALQ